jgi:nitrate reductase delta subunit
VNPASPVLPSAVDVVPALPARVAALDALASLLEYPTEGFAERAAAARAVVLDFVPRAAATLEPFLRHLEDATHTAHEEGFTRTFDWSPTCCLEVGWHIYGEQYDRGAFMVAMRERLRSLGIEEGTDLPDHLGLCLRYVGRAPAAEGAAFADAALLPALEKMRAGFGGGPAPGVAPYAAVLRAVQEAVRDLAEADHPVARGC